MTGNFPIRISNSYSVSSPGLSGRSSIPETAVLEPMGLWNTGCPACAGHDGGGRDCEIPRRELHPGLATITLARKEGAGNTGCFVHPQPRMQMKKAYELVTTGSPKRSGIPCAMVYDLLRALADVRDLLVTVMRRSSACALGTSPGVPRPHAFAVRVATFASCRDLRPPHPTPDVRDDGETPLVWAWDSQLSAPVSDFPQ